MIKQLIPKSIKRSLRQWHRNHTLRHSIAITKENLQRNEPLSTDLLEKLIYGWSNEGWSANAALLHTLLVESVNKQQSILECGTGISTVLFTMISRNSGGKVRSLEHHAEWHKHISQRLGSLGLPIDGVTLAPLKNHGAFDWYDIAGLPDSETYDLVLCDGPPDSTRGGRYGLLPLIFSRLAPGARIIVDDTSRTGESEMIQNWLKVYGDALHVVEQHKTFTVLVAKGKI